MTMKTKQNDHNELDKKLVTKAVDALMGYHTKNCMNSKKDLLENDVAIQVQFGLEIAPIRPSPKPVRVMIPHSLYGVAANLSGKSDDESDQDNELDEAEVCLIVKEESKEWVQDMILQFPKEMGCVKKVLGLQSLRKKYARYEQRRALLHKYNIFMGDDRITPMLTKCLGKEFVKSKKLPIPIRLTRKEALPVSILKAIQGATYYSLNEGTCITIKSGYTNMSASKIVDNIMAVSANASRSIPKSWCNIRAISIKTPSSIALPIYNKTPEELYQISIMAGVARDIEEEAEENEEDEEEKKNKMEQKKKEDKKKRKSKKNEGEKNPLLQALKKQKQNDDDVAVPAVVVDTTPKKKEVEKKTITTPKSSSKKDKKKKRKSSIDEIMDEEDDAIPTINTSTTTPEKEKEQKEERTPKSSSKKEKKKKRKSSIDEIMDADDDDAIPAITTTTTTTPEKKKESKVETPKSSSKKEKKKKRKSLENKEATKETEEKVVESKKPAAFISSPKFKGSKKGYVFKKDTNGIGYYMDEMPVIDRMAMEALSRSAGGGGKGRRSSTRGASKRRSGSRGRKSY